MSAINTVNHISREIIKSKVVLSDEASVPSDIITEINKNIEDY